LINSEEIFMNASDQALDQAKHYGFRGPDPSVGRATQFKPGVSGNPGGRPKMKPLTDAYRALLTAPVPDDLRKVRRRGKEILLPEGSTYADWIAYGQVWAAAEGNTAAAAEITDRLEGKVPKPVELDVNGVFSLAERLEAARERLRQRSLQTEAGSAPLPI
jgi:hypothetical protein